MRYPQFAFNPARTAALLILIALSTESPTASLHAQNNTKADPRLTTALSNFDRSKQFTRQIIARGSVREFLVKNATPRTTNEIKQEQGTTRVVRYLRDGDNECLDYYPNLEANEDFHRIIVVNPSGGFVLRANVADAKPYIEIPNVPQNYKNSLKLQKQTVADAPFSVFNDDVRVVLGASECRVTSITTEKIDTSDVDVFAFSYKKKPLKEGSSDLIMEGRLWLDPNISHALRRYDVRVFKQTDPTQNVHATGNVSYFEDHGLPRPKHVVQETLHWHGQFLRHEFLADDWRYERPNPEEFSLDFYGLGDFARPIDVQSSSRWPYWPILPAAILLIGGIWLRKRGR